MIIYEITAKVRLDLCESYEKYMRKTHIPDLLKTGAFSGASISQAEPGTYRISYEASSREKLDRYLREHAPALRKDAEEHFPEGVGLSRTEWTVLEKW
jgi:Domain of unknown function (DUF4286)